MNERIKQLAVEAGLLPREIGPVVETRHMKKKEQDIEKFAELIVRECAGLFPNVYVEIENEYGHTPVVAANYIKKHFGVEE